MVSAASVPPAPTRQAMARSRETLGLYTLMIFAWMFDFRAESQGSGLAFQLVFFAVYLVSFAVFLVRERGGRMFVPGLLPVMAASAGFMVIGTMSGLVNGQQYYDIFRNSFTLIIYITSIFATVRLVEQVNAGAIRGRLAWLCLGFTLSSMLILLATTGINFSTIRYQILGTSTLSAMGYLTMAMMFTLSQPEIVTLLIALALVFLSITRTMFVAQFFQLLPAWPALRRLLTPRIIVAGVFVAVIGLGFATVTSTAFDRWGQRVSGGQDGREDATAYTRRVETEFMLRHWLHDGQSTVFGNGLAARTEYYEPKWVGGKMEWSIGFGHDQHVSLLFIAGLAGGVPLLFVHFWQLWAAVQFLYRASVRGRWHNNVLFLGCWGATTVIGTVFSNFLSSSFGNRGVSLWYGIGTGLLLGARACYDHRNSWISSVHPDLFNTAQAVAPQRQVGAPPRSPAMQDNVPVAVRQRREALARMNRQQASHQEPHA